MQLVQEAAYGEGSPLGSSVLSHNLSKLSMHEVLQYRHAHFVRNNLVVAANGLSQDRLEALLTKGGARIHEGAAHAAAASPYVGGEVKVRTDLNGLTHVALGFPVPAGEAGTSCPSRTHT